MTNARIAVLTFLIAASIGALAADDPRISELVRKRNAAKAEMEKAQKDLDTLSPAISGKPVPPSDAPKNGPTEFVDLVKKVDLKVRRSLKDKNVAEDPALFQYAHPGEGKDSWAVDGGLSLGRDLIGIGNTRVSGALVTEYHYTSATTQPKDTLVAGGSLDFSVGTNTASVQMFRATASYKRDRILAGDGLLTDILYFPSENITGIGGFYREWIPGLEGRIEPFAGLQFETGSGAAKGFHEGERLSFRAGVTLAALIAPKCFGNRLELSNSLGYWGHLSRSGVFDQYGVNQLFLSSSLTYWLNTSSKGDGVLAKDDRHFGVTVRYTNGNNPDEGTFDANLVSVGFAVLF